MSIKTRILYTFFYSLGSNAKLRINAELSDHKNTVKIFTNFGRFFIIFSVLKKARMGQCCSHAKSVQKENNTPNYIKCYNSGPILLNDVFNDLDRSNIYLRS